MSRVDVKIVLLGKEFGGKTSLVERYVHRRFNEKAVNKYQATIGAAYASKKIDADSTSITLGIWDTAGSERYEALSRMYYRNARAAIVCFDLTDATSFEKCKFWVSELKQQEETCKIYLCGTKRDLIVADASQRQVSEKSIADYARLVDAQTFETSSRTGENVDELFFNIAMDYIQFEMQLEDDSSKHTLQFVLFHFRLNREYDTNCVSGIEAEELLLLMNSIHKHLLNATNKLILLNRAIFDYRLRLTSSIIYMFYLSMRSFKYKYTAK